MKKENQESQVPQRSLLRNWLSLTGLVMVIGALFSFLQLFMLDTVAHFSNPYISILTWMVTPAFLVLGLFLTVDWRVARAAPAEGSASMVSTVQIDLSRPRDRRNMVIFLVGGLLFIMLSAVGSYNAFNSRNRSNFAARPATGS